MARTRREVIHRPAIIRELSVIDSLNITPTTRRVVLGGQQLGSFPVAGGEAPAFVSEGFDDHVKLLVPFADQERPPLPVQGPDRLEWGAAGGRPVAKDYTPRTFDGHSVAFDFVLHGDGFASNWAERVEPGSPAWIVGPTRSSLWPTGIDGIVLAADETALPAVGRAFDEWTAGRKLPARVVVEVPSPASIQELAVPAGVEVVWVHGREAWVQAIQDLEWPGGEVFVWVAGEAGAVRNIRKFVTQKREVPRDLLDATGYWRA